MNIEIELLNEKYNNHYRIDYNAIDNINWDFVRENWCEPVELAVLSFGGGQDSTTILHILKKVREVRQFYAPKKLIVVMSNTDNEHPSTYKHVEWISDFCEENNIEFYFLEAWNGYHYDKWQGLKQFYNRTRTVGSKCFRKTCTDNLKIKPIYKFLEHYISQNYNLNHGRKKAFYEFAEKYGKIRMMIGIAKGEESRVAKRSDKEPKWKQVAIEMSYPLIDLNMDRNACQSYLRAIGEEIPLPSNCMICPFMSKIELLWLYNFYPEEYNDWVRIEQNKILKYLDMIEEDKNLGVWGKKLLPAILEEAKSEYGHLTKEQLHEYKMSHGHCVKSKY